MLYGGREYPLYTPQRFSCRHFVPACHVHCAKYLVFAIRHHLMRQSKKQINNSFGGNIFNVDGKTFYINISAKFLLNLKIAVQVDVVFMFLEQQHKICDSHTTENKQEFYFKLHFFFTLHNHAYMLVYIITIV